MHRFIYILSILCPITLLGQVFQWEEPTTRTTPAPTTTTTERTADAVYTIQVGTFYEPTLGDFNAIQTLGPLYSIKNEDQTYQVFMGTFDELTKVEKTVQQLQAKGYSAFAQPLATTQQQEAIVIQLLSTNNGKKLQWGQLEQIGNLYGLLENSKVFKVVTGPFVNKQVAADQLVALRAKGFKDAFVKSVPAQLLSPLGYFEKGKTATSYAKDLADEIDRIAESQASAATTDVQKPTPSTYSTTENVISTEATEAELISPATASTELAKPVETYALPLPKTALPVPTINSKVKRTSALDLQKILKSEKHYAGSLDGYYGKGTALGYTQFSQQDYRYKKYQLVAAHLVPKEEATTTGLQYLINSLTNNDASLIAALHRSSHPIAKAYLAYWKFNNQGPSADVNHLLNTAIQESFQAQKIKNSPPFDYKATYDYTTLKLVLLHLRYLHAAPANGNYAIPCWVFERHPKEASEVYHSNKLATLSNLQISGCMRFDEWESIKALRYFAQELQPKTLAPSDIILMNTHTTGRTFLYLFPSALNKVQKKEIDQWKIEFWKGLFAATNQYPLLDKYCPTLQTVFYQSQVLIEDYYMQLGFTADEAEGLALSVLKTYVEIPLEIYLK